MSPNNTMGTPMTGASVTVAYTGTAGTTTALPASTQGVRCLSSTDCFIEIGLTPTAVANTGLYLPAGVPEYFSCQGSSKVSAIQVTTGGSIYVTPFA
jgi:hypothetical protein